LRSAALLAYRANWGCHCAATQGGPRPGRPLRERRRDRPRTLPAGALQGQRPGALLGLGLLWVRETDLALDAGLVGVVNM
jgi:hypothetical protein